MFRIAAVAVALAAIASTAHAVPGLQQTAPNPSEAITPAAMSDHDPMKVVCRTVRPPTGTRLQGSRARERVCQTQQDWDNQRAEAQAAARAAMTGDKTANDRDFIGVGGISPNNAGGPH